MYFREEYEDLGENDMPENTCSESCTLRKEMVCCIECPSHDTCRYVCDRLGELGDKNYKQCECYKEED